MRSLYVNIYAQPPLLMVLETALIPFLWAWVLAFTAKRAALQKLLNAVLLAAAACLILEITILNRTPHASARLNLEPFRLLRIALRQKRELIRSILLNVFLFAPFGSATVNLLPDRRSVRRRVLLTCLIGGFASAFVELAQFRSMLGDAETDDLICNTLGALIGALSLPIGRWLRSKVIEQKEEKQS